MELNKLVHGETGGLGPKDRSEEAQIRLKRSEWED